MANHRVLIAGEWREAQSRRSFGSENPALGEKLPGEYPVSEWRDCDAALAAATAAAAVLRGSLPSPLFRRLRVRKETDPGFSSPRATAPPTSRAGRHPGARAAACPSSACR